MTADMVRNSARRRGFPARGILLGLALLLALDIGRYLFWPPVSRLAFINPPFTSMMEYRREQQEARQTEQGKKGGGGGGGATNKKKKKRVGGGGGAHTNKKKTTKT